VLKLACAAVAVRSTGDRAWSFVLPLFLSEASPSSLVPVSLLSLSLSLSVVLLGPPLAQWLATHRSPSRALTSLVIVENVAVVLGGAAVVAAARNGGDGGASGLVRQPLFGVGLLLLAVDAAVTSVLSVLIEKDVIGRLFLLAPPQVRVRARLRLSVRVRVRVRVRVTLRVRARVRLR
jgi:hypothetical protein